MPPNSDAAHPSAIRALPVRRIGARAGDGIDEIAVEMPVSIVYGAVAYAVMMASPADIEDFVTGFSLTEGIIEAAAEIRSIRVEPSQKGLLATVTLEPGRYRAHLARRRSMSGRTSCGVCGVEDEAALPVAARPVSEAPPVRPAAITAALAGLGARQPINSLTRAVHAAAWVAPDGTIVTVREDVGRHNALDKLIGAVLRSGDTGRAGFVLVTSRASFEMVEKTAIFGAATLVAISAPTSLAIERAEALGLTLVAVARADGMALYCGGLADEAPQARP